MKDIRYEGYTGTFEYNRSNNYVCLGEEKRRGKSISMTHQNKEKKKEKDCPIFRTNNNVPDVFLDETDAFPYMLYVEIAKN